MDGEADHILLVDDDPMVRSCVAAQLSALGYRVSAAGSADDALALLNDANDITLLLTDLMMPGLDGRSLAERARNVQPGLRVLFTSGDGAPMLKVRGPESGSRAGEHFLPKPFRRGQLNETLRRALEA